MFLATSGCKLVWKMKFVRLAVCLCVRTSMIELEEFDAEKTKQKPMSYQETFELCRAQGLFARYPRSDDGFCRAFDVHAERELWLDALDQHGVVVLRVLDEAQARRTEEAFWREVHEQVPNSPLRLVVLFLFEFFVG